jgi:hypothetical protein
MLRRIQLAYVEEEGDKEDCKITPSVILHLIGRHSFTLRFDFNYL